MVIDHLQKVHQSYNSNAYFVCNDDLSDYCSTESSKRPQYAAMARFGCLSCLILIIDDAWYLSGQLVFEEPKYQAYHYQSILS